MIDVRKNANMVGDALVRTSVEYLVKTPGPCSFKVGREERCDRVEYVVVKL